MAGSPLCSALDPGDQSLPTENGAIIKAIRTGTHPDQEFKNTHMAVGDLHECHIGAQAVFDLRKCKTAVCPNVVDCFVLFGSTWK